MSMPQIPEEKHRPCLKETVIDLLESIALEEIALSHLVNAEAEKTQTFVCMAKDKHSCHKEKDFLEFNESIRRIIDTVIMKEWILLKKLENVLQIDYKCDDKENDCRHHKHCHNHCEEEYECDECNNHIKVKVKCDCNNKECDECVKIKIKCGCHEECDEDCHKGCREDCNKDYVEDFFKDCRDDDDD